VIRLDEESIRKKFRDIKELEEKAYDEKHIETKEIDKESEELKSSIEDETYSWEEDLPWELEIIDEKPFAVTASGLSLHLDKKKGSENLYVTAIKGDKIVNEEIVSDFIETVEASKEILLKLKARIPDFIQYIATKI